MPIQYISYKTFVGANSIIPNQIGGSLVTLSPGNSLVMHQLISQLDHYIKMYLIGAIEKSHMIEQVDTTQLCKCKIPSRSLDIAKYVKYNFKVAILFTQIWIC